MPITQHFIVEGKYLGSAERQMVYVHGQRQVPLSLAYFCPVCGELWAKCPVEVVPGQAERFHVMTHACRKHWHHRYEVPGSIMVDWEEGLNEALPDDVVRWEFQRHLEFLNKIGG